MNRMTFVATVMGLSFAGPVLAQTGGATAPETKTVVSPAPGAVVTQAAPDVLLITPVPGLVTATRVKVQKFSDYDLDKDGVYNPMEFAQALYFLATSDPVAGNPKLPADDKYVHKGAPQTMQPDNAIALLNATADELWRVDANHDWRVSPQELVAIGLM